MENDEIINKWKLSFAEDKDTLKKLSKLNNISTDNPFFSNLFFDSKKIIARLGIGYGKLNKLVINSIAYSFGEILKKMNDTKDFIDILVCSDGSPEIKPFLKNISDVFYAQKLVITAFKSYAGYDIKFICRTIGRLKISAGIYIERSIYNNNIFNVFFIDHKGNYFSEEFFQEMKNEMSKHDIFSINSQSSKVDFLSNNRVINDYTQKLLSLSNRKGDQKKIKIAISNYNNGVTNILQKILGNMDFNYIINNNINKGNVHQSKNRNERSFTSFYKRDIFFSKENKCDMLICPSKNGTELNLFVFNGRQVFYLDANEITLMFLNFFLIEVNISTKKLPNSYIGTDIPPIQSIKNLIKKYNLELSVSEDVKASDDKFLLFYWNQNSEFIFGENTIIEFGFYHLIVKFLEMINYYKTQRLTIPALRNILTKMYGSYKTHIIILNFDLTRLYSFLNNINNSLLNTKFPVENIVIFEHSTVLNENLIANILLKNGIELLVKFNYLNRKIVIFTRLEDVNSKIWSRDYISKNSFVKHLTSIIKKDLKHII